MFLTTNLLSVASAVAKGAGATAATVPIGMPDPPGIPWVRIILALFFCLAVSVGAILVLRRFHNRGSAQHLFAGIKGMTSSNEIEVVETRRASIHAHICLIHYRDHAYVIATTAQGATLIDKCPREPDAGRAGS